MNKSTITLLSSITLGAAIGLMAVDRVKKQAGIECADTGKIGALPDRNDAHRETRWPVVTTD